MSSVNKVILVGHLAADPEVRYTNSGSAVANFRMATNESWTDKSSGNKEEHTEWHRIVAWGKLAELCGEYLKKGRQSYVEGKLRSRSWETKEGEKRYTTEIVASSVVFLGSRADSRAGAYDSGAQEMPSQGSEPPPSGDDDIPF